MYIFKFYDTQSDVLTSVTSVISYIDPLRDAAILTPYMTCASHNTYFYVTSVENSALWPHLFLVALPIIQNINQMDRASLLFQPD